MNADRYCLVCRHPLHPGVACVARCSICDNWHRGQCVYLCRTCGEVGHSERHCIVLPGYQGIGHGGDLSQLQAGAGNVDPLSSRSVTVSEGTTVEVHQTSTICFQVCYHLRSCLNRQFRFIPVN